MIETFQALSEPNRLRIVELLRGGPRPVGEIGERLDLRQPQVSKHLRVLRDAGLVDVQARAQQRLYELRGAPLAQLHDWLERYRGLWDARFFEIDVVLEELKRSERLQRTAAVDDTATDNDTARTKTSNQEKRHGRRKRD